MSPNFPSPMNAFPFVKPPIRAPFCMVPPWIAEIVKLVGLFRDTLIAVPPAHHSTTVDELVARQAGRREITSDGPVAKRRGNAGTDLHAARRSLRDWCSAAFKRRHTLPADYFPGTRRQSIRARNAWSLRKNAHRDRKPNIDHLKIEIQILNRSEI